MDASAYNMSFDKEQLSVLCANYDRRIDALAKENAKLQELIRDIDEVADPYLWGFIGQRKKELGIEVDG